MAFCSFETQSSENPNSLQGVLKRNNTILLADTLDFQSLSLHNFSGSLLTPERICDGLATGGLGFSLTAAANKCLQDSNDADAMRKRRGRQECISRVIEHLFLEVAASVADRVSGPHIVHIDPRNHDSVDLLVAAAQRMHTLFRDKGMSQESIIVSIPATEAGIRAAEILECQGILTNLYLVTGLVHAALCVETKTAAVSVAIGPLLSVYEAKAKKKYEDLSKHPGIEVIRTILKYFELNEIRTKVLGSAFRSLDEVGQLSECDAVCITDSQADSLKWSTVPIADTRGEEGRRIELRAKQAKYPTDLLTRRSGTKDSQKPNTLVGGGFETWLSPDSRSVTKAVLDTELHKLTLQMEMIQKYAETEIDRLAAFRATTTWIVGYRAGSPGLQWKAYRGEKSPVRTPTASPASTSKLKKSYTSTAHAEFLKHFNDTQKEQNMDDVF